MYNIQYNDRWMMNIDPELLGLANRLLLVPHLGPFPFLKVENPYFSKYI